MRLSYSNFDSNPFETFTFFFYLRKTLIPKPIPYLILDLEMTGGETGYHDIIQIGAVLANDDWKILSEFQSLVYPDHEENFTAAAEEIHGITLADLAEAPKPYEVLENFEIWIRKNLRLNSSISLTDIVVCGQSVINDINFLEQSYSDQNLVWPSCSA